MKMGGGLDCCMYGYSFLDTDSKDKFFFQLPCFQVDEGGAEKNVVHGLLISKIEFQREHNPMILYICNCPLSTPKIVINGQLF